MALLLAGLMSVNAAGDSIVNFIVKTYEDFKEILFTGDGAAKIDHVYAFAEVPEGFTETERVLNDDMSFMRYENSETGAVIELHQTATDDASFALDKENNNSRIFSYRGKEIIACYSESAGTYDAFWTEDECNMKLMCLGITNFDELFDMVSALE